MWVQLCHLAEIQESHLAAAGTEPQTTDSRGWHTRLYVQCKLPNLFLNKTFQSNQILFKYSLKCLLQLILIADVLQLLAHHLQELIELDYPITTRLHLIKSVFSYWKTTTAA